MTSDKEYFAGLEKDAKTREFIFVVGVSIGVFLFLAGCVSLVIEFGVPHLSVLSTLKWTAGIFAAVALVSALAATSVLFVGAFFAAEDFEVFRLHAVASAHSS